MTTETAFFLELRGEATVWCAEHDAPVDSWKPGPVFKDRAEAIEFIANTREWYESDTRPSECMFRHPETVA